MRRPWFAPRVEQPTGRGFALAVMSFVLPLALWCYVSYVPGAWHPYTQVHVGGGSSYGIDDLVPNEDYSTAQDAVIANNALRAQGIDPDSVDNPDYRPPLASALARDNKDVLKQFGSYAASQGWLEIADLRSVDTMATCLQQYAAGELGPGTPPLNATNQAIVAEIAATLAPLQSEGAKLDLRKLERRLPDLQMQGELANPIFLPAPHEVAEAFYLAFVTPPRRDEDPWLHERLQQTLHVVAVAFGLALLVGIPLGIMCGTFSFAAKLTEPFVGFVSYIPPPAFGALLIAIMGIDDAPKIAMVFIASFFPMVLMVSKTTKLLDTSLLEAAQTLGAKRRSLIGRVILPGIMPNLYNDVRILLALSWTILIIAELTGTRSGISDYMYQQGRYRNFDNVFAAMVMIGIIGLALDRLLAFLAPFLFPWHHPSPGPIATSLMRRMTWLPRQLRDAVREQRERVMEGERARLEVKP